MKTDDSDRSLKWRQAWESEYRKQGIPSSFRNTPARVVTEFYSWLEKQHFKGFQAADLGCGRGRNSFYLASKGFSVTALDLLKENADHVVNQAHLMKLPIHAYAQSAAEAWPISSNSLDLAIDIFCYKHITNKDAQASYRNELARTLKPSGYYFLSLASENDGFYGPFLANSPSLKQKLVIDPYAKIESYLYSISDLTQEFGDQFTVIEAIEQESSSPMHGKEYTRKVLNLIMRKKIKTTENLFSYGTLKYENVQLATFGRKLNGQKDSLPCYRLEKVRITDPDVIAKSGEDVHSIIFFSGDPSDEVQGMVFQVSLEELQAADSYEVSDYKRIKVTLSSGCLAWVYVSVNSIVEI